MESNGLITEYHIRCSGVRPSVQPDTDTDHSHQHSVDSYHTLTIPVASQLTPVLEKDLQ